MAGRIAGQGSNWIRKAKRIALYNRDGYACAYCMRDIETCNDILLTLDHIKPCSKGGTNEATNLVTACHTCNSARGNKPLLTFCKQAIAFFNLDISAEKLAQQIRKQAKQPFSVETSKPAQVKKLKAA